MITLETVRKYVESKKGTISDEHWLLLKMFVDELISENQTPRSVYTALYRVYMYLRFLEEKGKSIDNATPIDIKMYLATRTKDSTRHRIAAALKRFYRFLYENIDPKFKQVYEGFKVKPPKNYPIPEIPPENEVRKIIENLQQPYKSIMAIAYETGARISEILTLRIRDIEDCGDYIRIHIRKSKSEQRVVYLVEYRKVLLEWLKRHAFKNNPNEYLFYAPRTYKRPMLGSDIYMALRRVKKKLGIRIRITPHLLRHLRATELYYKFRLKEKEIMKLMGWRTRTMIDIYVKALGDPDLEERYLALVYGLGGNREADEYIECPRCYTKNPRAANYCWRCGLPLAPTTVMEKEKEREELVKLVEKLKEILLKNPEALRKLFEGTS